jgi:hypothetical protein
MINGGQPAGSSASASTASAASAASAPATASAATAARAWECASAVVGLYGDPTVPWSIALDAALREPLRPKAVAERMAALAAEHPHLGPPAPVQRIPDGERAHTLESAFAGLPYGPDRSLVRIGVADSPPALLVAAHHGAVDGIGLLAVLQAALGQPVRARAAGLGDRPPAHSFARSAVRRAGEALFAPPARLRVAPGPPGGGRDGEALRELVLPVARVDTAALAAAAGAATRWWNRDGNDRIVVAVGASRRPGSEMRPEHRAAYLRLRLPTAADPALVRRALREHHPEPDFPPSRSRVLALARRALAGRLGATILVSNLGVVETGGAVTSLSFYPQPSGPAGIAFGLVSTEASTTLTVRARRRDFDPASLAQLLDRLAGSLTELGSPSTRGVEQGPAPHST